MGRFIHSVTMGQSQSTSDYIQLSEVKRCERNGKSTTVYAHGKLALSDRQYQNNNDGGLSKQISTNTRSIPKKQGYEKLN